MSRYPDNFFDLAVVDPPYGISINMNMGRSKNAKTKKHTNKKWDNCIPDSSYFNELFRVSKNQIIWGGNYMTCYLPPKQGWIFWDKCVHEGVSFSDGELAWTSFDIALKSVTIPYCGFRGREDVRIHPTQKPVKLYSWIFKNYAKKGMKILDTHLGSGSSRIAAYQAGLYFVGCEIDKEYFEDQEMRFSQFLSAPTLFNLNFF